MNDPCGRTAPPPSSARSAGGYDFTLTPRREGAIDGLPVFEQERKESWRSNGPTGNGGRRMDLELMEGLMEGVVMDPLRDVTEARRIRKVLGA